MKHALVLLLALLSAVPVSSFAQEYAWTISTSSADPEANVGSISGLANVYLWLLCSNTPTVMGMTSAEFRLEGVDLQILGVTARDGFEMDPAVDLPNVLMRTTPSGSCVTGPRVVANVVVNGSVGGGLCYAPTSTSGLQVTRDCQAQPFDHQFNWIGLDNGGGACTAGPACQFGPVSVESAGWGRVKALYRSR